MTKYERELMGFRPDDEIHCSGVCEYSGRSFISTAGHGYLVVPNHDEGFMIAAMMVEYGYRGKLAVYLEEDCEAPKFLEAIGKAPKMASTESRQLNLFA
jgi:hypothetical protein